MFGSTIAIIMNSIALYFVFDVAITLHSMHVFIEPVGIKMSIKFLGLPSLTKVCNCRYTKWPAMGLHVIESC